MDYILYTPFIRNVPKGILINTESRSVVALVLGVLVGTDYIQI